MSDLRKAAEMALEVLEEVEQVYGSPSEWFNERLQALRTALAQPDEVLAEREACAKVCLSEKDGWLNPPTIAALNNVLNGIRARGEK